MTRLETFTDAAFAFALTLLVISFEPPTSIDGLLAALREVPAFLVSATFLMIFWWGHHQWSRWYGLDDGPTIVLSCVLVFTVLVYVVPLRFLAAAFFLWIERASGLPVGSTRLDMAGPEALNIMFTVYGIGFLAMAGSIVLLHWHALRRRDELELSPVEVHETRTVAGIWGILAITGGLSALVASLTEPSVFGLPGWMYMVLPAAIPLYVRRGERNRPGLEAPARPSEEA